MKKHERLEQWLNTFSGKDLVVYSIAGELDAMKVWAFKLWLDSLYADIHFVTDGENQVIPPFFDGGNQLPRPKDKALKQYIHALTINSGNDIWIACLKEINERLKALEAANESV